MHYQLFIPECDKPLGTPQAALESLGLGDFVAGHEGISTAGPEENRGILYCWRKAATPNSLHYNGSQQTWIPAIPNGEGGEGKGRYWVGFWNDSPPTPDDLQRKHATYGKAVTLNDGKAWVFPVVEDFTRDLIRSPDDGSWRAHVKEEHSACFFEAKKWAGIIDGGTPFNFAELADFVERTLSLNYRLVPEVASFLKLFDTENVGLCLSTILSLTAEIKS